MDNATAPNRPDYGRYVLGAGNVFIGALCLAFGAFNPGQPVPKAFPHRMELAYVVGAFLLIGGLALEWRRTVVWGAAALALYYWIIDVALLNGRVVLANYNVYGAYEGIAIQTAVACGILLVYAAHVNIDATLARRLVRAAQIAFGIAAVIFGGAHFVYMNLTAPLVPKWLPPNQVFWGYATGVFHIAAGLAILSGIQARLATILLTIMFASWTPLVHIPTLFADPTNHFFWTENAENLALTGAAWVLAESFARSKR